jgi:predicted transcriptional regulator
MRTKKGLTIERHNAIGKELKTISSHLNAVFIEVANAYPLKSRQVRELEKADKALQHARNELDNRMFREHGEKSDPGTYFGKTVDEKENG